jgi:predicted small secreted protein
MVFFRYSKWILPVFIVFCATWFSGCGTIRTVGEKISPAALAKKVTPRTAQLKKRVMVFDPVDQAGYGPEATAQIARKLEASLVAHSRFVLQNPPKGMAWAGTGGGLDLRIAAPLELLDFCRMEGITAIVTLVLSPVENTPRTTGIWPFKSQSIAFEIPVRLTALDVSSGTVLFTRSTVEEDIVKLIDAEMSTDRELLDRFSALILSRIVPRQVDELVEAMDGLLWRGSIISIEDGRVIINAGIDLGVSKGSRFEVLDEGEPVSTKDGRTLTVPGAAIEELIVTQPGPRTSSAEPAGDAALKPGLEIRYKP